MLFSFSAEFRFGYLSDFPVVSLLLLCSGGLSSWPCCAKEAEEREHSSVCVHHSP